MAVYFEKYDPWREQLAGSILAPLLKMAIDGSQAANQSRKENAFISEAMKEFQPQVDTSMPTLQGFQGPRPSSPWEQAAGDAGLMQGFDPSFGAQAMQPPARDMRDIQARLAELQASPRFNMLNPDRTRQLLAPMMDQYAAAENARRMQDFFAQFEGKQDPFERLLLMGQGAGMKYLPDNALSNYVDLYKHQTPHQDFKLVDSGDKVTGYRFDPANGAVSEVLSQMIRLSPSQAGSLANERSRIGISAGDLALRQSIFDWQKTHGGLGGGSGSAYQRMPEKDKIQLQSLMRQKEGIIRDAAIVGYGPGTQATLDDIEQKIQRLLSDEGGQGGQPAQQQVGGTAISPQEYQALKDRGFTDEQLRHYGYEVR